MRIDSIHAASAARICTRTLSAVAIFALPSLASAAILEPSTRTVSADGKSVTLGDVYSTEDTIEVRTSASSSCTIYDGSGAAVGWVTTKSYYGSYSAEYTVDPADEIGDWKVVCGSSSAWFVVDDNHEALWLDQGYEGLIDDYIGGGGAKSTYSWAAPAIGTSPYWVNTNGWYYLQYTVLPTYSYAFASKIPSPAGKVTSSSTQEPWEMLYKSGGLAFAHALQRIALTEGMISAYSEDPTLPADSAESKEDYYLKAVKFWGDYLVSIPDWSNATLPSAYKDSSGKIVYCGTGSCYTKDGSGNKVAFSGTKTQLTASLDDLEVGTLLIALAAAYDWAFDDLGADRRRDWADKLVEETIRFQNDRDMPLAWSSYEPNHLRNIATNTHTYVHHAAVGIVTYVLYEEMADSASTRDTWLNTADTGFDKFLAALGSDGADHNGVGYWEFGIEYLIRYIEAARTIGFDQSFYADAWLRNTPKYLLHNTFPNQQRVNFGDASYADRSTVAGPVARIASQYKDGLSQRIAWQGHNAWSNSSGIPRRDYLDILWWDETVTPLKDINTVETDTCFADHGLVSVRTGWGAGDAHLAYRGGPIIGAHDDPDVGSFVLYKDGHLVTSDGENLDSKRTAVHSTMLVDGKGQHGDGMDVSTYAPEGTNNNGVLFAYLDNSGQKNRSAIDVVTFASDLTQLYRYDSTDEPHVGNTQTDTSSKKLTELTRHMVWLGEAALVLDRFNATGSYRIDWNLNSGKMLDANKNGIEDNDDPDTCPVKNGAKSGYYAYVDSYGKQTDLAFGYDKVQYCTSSGCPTNSSDFTKVNTSALAPKKDTTFTKYSCEDHITYSSSSAKASIRTPSTIGGGMDVVALDALRWSKQASPYLDGGDIFAYHLNRKQSASSGTFLTALLPYGSTGAPTASASSKAVTGGNDISVDMAQHDATVLFAKPGSTSVTGSVGSVAGTLGVIVRDAYTTVTVAQMVNGTSLYWSGKKLLSATASASVGVTYENDSAWGTIQPKAGTNTTVEIRTPFTPSSVTKVLVNGANASGFSRTTTGIKLTMSKPGTFAIYTASGDGPAGPGSICGG